MTERQDNPYAATAIDNPTSSNAALRCDFGPIARRWERLRILYNAILAAGVLLCTLAAKFEARTDPVYWAAILIGAFIANLCYLTGPAIEAYGMLYRVWNPVFTILLFLAGTAFAGLLAIASIAAY